MNGKCANCRLSQRRGSPRITVPKIVPMLARLGANQRESVFRVVLQVSDWNKGSKKGRRSPEPLGSHFEEFVDEPILTSDATPAQPSHLALPNYVHRLITTVVQIRFDPPRVRG
jgi:hypothetical protein